MNEKFLAIKFLAIEIELDNRKLPESNLETDLDQTRSVDKEVQQ